MGKIKLAFPALIIGSYWGTLYSIGGFRGDHLFLGIGLLLVLYLGRPQFRQNRLLRFPLPYFLTLIIYDGQRFFGEYIRGRIHLEEPYLFDKTFFGITTANGVLTPNEWLQNHIHPFLDLITGFAYLTFFAAFVLVSVYFIFYQSKFGSAKFSPQEFSKRAARMPWAFFWLNMLGYSTYYWYASAPPWYVAKYGFGPVQMVGPDPAGCARFDQILGTHFFTELYNRSADVFGAIPSLHVAYPMLALYFAFHLKSLRIPCLLFYLLMCFSAVYLNHHYILDIMWGSAYAVLVGYFATSIPLEAPQSVAHPVGTSHKPMPTQ